VDHFVCFLFMFFSDQLECAKCVENEMRLARKRDNKLQNKKDYWQQNVWIKWIAAKNCVSKKWLIIRGLKFHDLKLPFFSSFQCSSSDDE